MKASDATSNDQNCEKRQAHGATFAKVLDGRKQPIRGLWIRGTRYYARLNVENPLTGIKKNQRVPLVTKDGTDDECYTYNARISRLPPIQEHRMIVKAVNDGVSMERVAAALNMPVHVVNASMNLLKGIHDQAADLLKDKNISPPAIRLLKKVNGMRQIEIAEMMVTHNNFFTGYAEALVLGTSKDQMVNPDVPKKKKGLSAEDIARMESEMESLERDLKTVTDNYTENMFTLQTAQTYIKNLLKNAKVVRYLNANHTEIATEFQNMAAAETV